MGVGRVILSPSVQDQPERKLLETPGITLPYFFNLPFPNHVFLCSVCVTHSVPLIGNMNDTLLVRIL